MDRRGAVIVEIVGRSAARLGQERWFPPATFPSNTGNPNRRRFVSLTFPL